MVWETRKILDAPNIMVNATCVRVPVFYGHSEAVHIETRTKISAADARALLAKSPGIRAIDERQNGGYPTAVRTVQVRTRYSLIASARTSPIHADLDLWIVSDNVRKGGRPQQCTNCRAFAK